MNSSIVRPATGSDDFIMTSRPDKQWRLNNVGHLKRLRLQFRRYTLRNESWDHDHCAACWAKFTEFEGPAIQHDGYATCDDYPEGACYVWICKTCFDEMKQDIGWSTINK